MFCRWAIVASVLLPASGLAQESTIAERHAEAITEFVAELEALSAKCDELDMPDQAEQTRAWLTPRKSGRTLLFLSSQSESVLAKGAEQREKQWHNRFTILRRAHAAKVYDLAAEAAGTQQGELALRLIYEVLHEDPDHAEAQRILGLKATVKRIPKARAVSGIHSTFGWKPGRHWQLETEHFKIESNFSAKACLELGETLERLHDVWRQVYFPLWGDNRLVAGRFATRTVDLSEAKRFHVVLFKDRAEYLKQLEMVGKAVAVSSGFYSDEKKLSFFYAGEGSKESTRYHEVTHQLIQEYLDAPAGIGKEHNIWMVEAAALFMESLVLGDGYALLGGYDADALQFARFRARGGDFQMPLAQLSSLGRDALQEHRDIRKIYGQMGGLGHFFMESPHRAPFLETLLAVYQGKAEVDALATACESSFDDLDRQYYAFLDVTDEMIARTPPLPDIRGLSLRKTQVTDQGLAAFKQCDQLLFLDLSLTAAGDAGLAAFPESKALLTLFLEGTKITDASLEQLARFPNLEELYLSGTPVTDEGLANLAPLKKLKLLDLSGCRLTDACLPALAQLKRLESLDTSGTEITPDGLTKLKRSLPKLEQ